MRLNTPEPSSPHPPLPTLASWRLGVSTLRSWPLRVSLAFEHRLGVADADDVAGLERLLRHFVTVDVHAIRRAQIRELVVRIDLTNAGVLARHRRIRKH